MWKEGIYRHLLARARHHMSEAPSRVVARLRNCKKIKCCWYINKFIKCDSGERMQVRETIQCLPKCLQVRCHQLKRHLFTSFHNVSSPQEPQERSTDQRTGQNWELRLTIFQKVLIIFLYWQMTNISRWLFTSDHFQISFRQQLPNALNPWYPTCGPLAFAVQLWNPVVSNKRFSL